MRPPLLVSLAGLLAVSACSKPAEKPAADTTAVVAPAPQPMAFVTVLYHQPKSAAKFEQYYWQTHVPLVQAKQAEVGFVGAELTQFDRNLDGTKPAYYRQAVLWFRDMADLERGVATFGFQAIGDDLPNFASGGLVALVGEETGDHRDWASGDSTALVTVIYNPPKDAAAFESYYTANHLPLVVRGAPAIAFDRAELTRFSRNLDGNAPVLYRQAKLYYPSMSALAHGTGTPEFKAVGDDLGHFASGGLTAMVGHVTRGK